MEKIVELFSRDLKRQVSASLAVLPDFPTNIVKNFAEDEDIEIARPVLRNAVSLTETISCVSPSAARRPT